PHSKNRRQNARSSCLDAGRVRVHQFHPGQFHSGQSCPDQSCSGYGWSGREHSNGIANSIVVSTSPPTRKNSVVSSRLENAYLACEQLSRRSGSTFFLAFQTLPRDMDRQMCVLYAFMRRTDDLSDQE